MNINKYSVTSNLYKGIFGVILFFTTLATFSQVTNTQVGSDDVWSNAVNWDNGVPTNGGTATINKTLSFGNVATAINITSGGTYVINADVNDPNNNGTLEMNGGTLDVKSGTIDFGGGVPFDLFGCFCNPLNSGTIYIRSGATLQIGGNLGVTFGDNLTIIVETGGTLVVDKIAVNNATIQNNGSIIYGSNWGGSGTTTGTGTVCNSNATPNSTAGCNSPVCVGGIINLTGNTVANATYKWVGPNGYSSTSTVTPNTSIANATAARAGTYTLTVIKSGCSRSHSTTLIVGTPAQPSVIVPSTTAPCQGATGITYSVVNTSGVSYNWSYTGTGASITSGSGTNSIKVSYSSTATSGQWNVTPNNSCGNGTTRSLVVSLSSLPAQPSTINGTTSPCKNSTVNIYSVTNVSGITYNWSYSGNGATIVSGNSTNSITVTYSNSATSGNWTVTPSSACGSGSPSILPVTMSSTPAQPTSITASVGTPCPNSTGVTYSVPNVSGLAYTWSYSGTGATITAGSTSRIITVNYTSATNGIWTVTPSNGTCTGPSQTLSETFGSAPAQPTTITASVANPCPNSTGITYSVPNVGGGLSYLWSYSGTGATITSGSTSRTITVTYSAATSGIWTVTPSNSTCTGTPQSLSVTLGSAPAQPASITSSIATPCPNSTGVIYSVPTISGLTYAWSYSGTGATIISGATSNAITVTYASATSGIWTVTPSNGTCTGPSQTLSETFGSVPAKPTSITASVGTPCPNSTGVTYSVPNVSGLTYTWSYSGTGATITSGSTSRTITVTYTSATNGIWTVTPSNGTCTGPSQTLSETFASAPAQPASVTASVANPCSNSTGITYSVPNVGGGLTYTWSYSGTGAMITAGSTTRTITVTYASATSGIWKVTPSNGTCTGIPQTLSVTLGSAPTQPTAITPSVANPCPNSTGNSYSVTNVSGVTYAWTYSGSGATITSGGTTNSITVTYASGTNGNWTVTPSNNCGTGTAQTLGVTFGGGPAQPSSINSSNANPCSNSTGNTYSVTNVSGLTYTWTYSGSGATITSGGTTNSITVTYASGTNGTWTVIPSNGCAIGTAQTLSVALGSGPAQPSMISVGNASPCPNSTGNICSVTNVAGVTYAWTYSGLGATITNGSNTNAITVTYASGTNGSWTVTPSNSCGIGIPQTFAIIISPCDFTWTGRNGTVWSDPANWTDNAIPGSGNDVLIPSWAQAMPIISGSASARGLTIQSGATLTNSSTGDLSISGDLINNGTFNANGLVSLNGLSAQAVSGVATFQDLKIDNSSGATLSNATTVKGILTLMKGSLHLNGQLLTLDLNTGAISGKGIGSIDGQIKVIKTIGTKWHHIGNPLGGTTIYFDQLADNTNIGNKYLYYYNEADLTPNMDIGWMPIAPANLASTNMVAMKGYNLYVGTRTTLDIIGDYNHNFSTTVPLSFSSSGDLLSDGWNLLSNPYPSTIDWDASVGWSKSGIDGAVYVYNKSQDKYMSYVMNGSTNTGSRYIGSMQGFWVKSNSPGSISINNNVRVDSEVKPLFKVQSEMSSMKLSVSCNGYSDETVIRLSEEGTSNFDPSIDAYKFKNFGNNPNISSQLNGVEYSINSISESIEDELIPLKLTTVFAGLYKLSVDLNEFVSNSEVVLIDKVLNVSQDLKLESNYTFQTSTLDADRFYIRLKQKTEVVTGLLSENKSSVVMGSDGSVVTIRLNSGLSIASMSIINMLGNEVYKNDEVSVAGGLIKEQIDVTSSGVYIVKLKIGDQIYTGKVFLK